MQRTGAIEKTVDREFDEEERRIKNLQQKSEKLHKEAKGYLDSLRAMTTAQVRIAETIDNFYEDSDNALVGSKYKQAVERLDDDCRNSLAILEPLGRFCAYFPDINESIKRRNKKLLDYDAMRSKVRKLVDKPSDDPTKLPRVEQQSETSREMYESLNSKLLEELPQLIDLRVDYIDPTFEAFVKIQMKFCQESYEQLDALQQYFPADRHVDVEQQEHPNITCSSPPSMPFSPSTTPIIEIFEPQLPQTPGNSLPSAGFLSSYSPTTPPFDDQSITNIPQTRNDISNNKPDTSNDNIAIYFESIQKETIDDDDDSHMLKNLLQSHIDDNNKNVNNINDNVNIQRQGNLTNSFEETNQRGYSQNDKNIQTKEIISNNQFNKEGITENNNHHRPQFENVTTTQQQFNPEALENLSKYSQIDSPPTVGSNSPLSPRPEENADGYGSLFAFDTTISNNNDNNSDGSFNMSENINNLFAENNNPQSSTYHMSNDSLFTYNYENNSTDMPTTPQENLTSLNQSIQSSSSSISILSDQNKSSEILDFAFANDIENGREIDQRMVFPWEENTSTDSPSQYSPNSNMTRPIENNQRQHQEHHHSNNNPSDNRQNHQHNKNLGDNSNFTTNSLLSPNFSNSNTTSFSPLPSFLEPNQSYFTSRSSAINSDNYDNYTIMGQNLGIKESQIQRQHQVASGNSSTGITPFDWSLSNPSNYAEFWQQHQRSQQQLSQLIHSSPSLFQYYRLGNNNSNNRNSSSPLSQQQQNLCKRSMRNDLGFQNEHDVSLNPSDPRNLLFNAQMQQDMFQIASPSSEPLRKRAKPLEMKNREFPNISFQEKSSKSTPSPISSPVLPFTPSAAAAAGYPPSCLENPKNFYNYLHHQHHQIDSQEYSQQNVETEEEESTAELPPADPNDTRPDSKPRRQRTRYPGDLYTPKWVRLMGQSKEGYCDLCEPGKWLQLKNSAYWYHKQFYHGISSVSGKYFVPPIDTRTVQANSSIIYSSSSMNSLPPTASSSSSTLGNTEGLCHQCQQWIPLTSTKKKTATTSVLWFRHAHKCHVYIKPKNAPSRKK
ncbi:7097_t:CDS:2 [Ambispora gerdemannii]|uniref:7097_t:CDS:1 n=1 Tax=Ambispora gerdemannii TaxID=144530 RepID=A0A9N8VIN1_9GLOM|nr:7097_t:CDS:2 [Ambispora gerdemannii]